MLSKPEYKTIIFKSRYKNTVHNRNSIYREDFNRYVCIELFINTYGEDLYYYKNLGLAGEPRNSNDFVGLFSHINYIEIPHNSSYLPLMI